jgi:hypothetical protein
MISLTKNLLKILNNNKKPLISSNKNKNKQMKKFIIIDWAGNHCFTKQTFKSFEDGWNFLYCKYPVIDGDDRDDELNEYYVIPIK